MGADLSTITLENGSAEKEFLLMQAKDLSNELRHTRSVCDNLKDELSDNRTRCERAENDKKQLKFAVKQMNMKIQEYQIMIQRLQYAYRNNEVYDMYDEDLRGHSEDSGIQDSGVSPMNDKEIQTQGSVVNSGVQCTMLNVQHLQNICEEIDAQIDSVDSIINQNKTSLCVLDSLFENDENESQGTIVAETQDDERDSDAESQDDVRDSDSQGDVRDSGSQGTTDAESQSDVRDSDDVIEHDDDVNYDQDTGYDEDTGADISTNKKENTEPDDYIAEK